MKDKNKQIVIDKKGRYNCGLLNPEKCLQLKPETKEYNEFSIEKKLLHQKFIECNKEQYEKWLEQYLRNR